MNNEKIYDIIKEYIGKDFVEESFDELKLIDKYYIDKEKEKFIFICKVFEDNIDLVNNWERYQDEKIALILQNKIFKNKDIRWDMYYLLIYKGSTELDELKCYEIERDKFCCKKLIINATTQELMREDLQCKLPVTNIYSNFSGNVDVANDEYFLEKVKIKSSFDVKKILEILNYNEE